MNNTFNKKCIHIMHQYYLKLLIGFGVHTNDTAYCWHKGSFLHFYIIFLSSEFGPQYVLFANLSRNKHNSFSIKSYGFYDNNSRRSLIATASTTNKVISLLITNNVLPKNIHPIPYTIKKSTINKKLAENFIKKFQISLSTKEFLNNYIKLLVYYEVQHNNSKYEQKSQVNIKFNENSFFERNFHFHNVMNGLNDPQFSNDLSECIFAYNHNKWYICATGIGSLIEELMFKIIYLHKYYYKNKRNYKNLDQCTQTSLGKIRHHNATAKDYERLFRAKPIQASDRSLNLIKAFFLMRNSVDHYNSGITNRITCDLLFSGIMSLYNDYYKNHNES